MAALAKQADPEMTPDKFMTFLINAAEDLGAAGYDTSYGNGLIDVEKRVDTGITP